MIINYSSVAGHLAKVIAHPRQMLHKPKAVKGVAIHPDQRFLLVDWCRRAVVYAAG